MHGHGSDCCFALWSKFFSSVAAEKDIIAIDFPGFGRSSGTTNQTMTWRADNTKLIFEILG
jgi:pimeloyl-ACP methyl ester carboxylesterase